MEKAASRAESRKGIMAVFIKPTIDAEHRYVLRIKVVTAGGETL